MATYKDIQRRVRGQTGWLSKTCWIAHVKSDLGLITRTAPNRFNPNVRQEPCPPDKRPAIMAALPELGVSARLGPEGEAFISTSTRTGRRAATGTSKRDLT